ncbi:TPA: hypothetical protein K8107_000350 [Staphylococcus pseudintermedius]|uniref:hypothetical protein n=1 Tax=Staphylococcus pseudintermedius TaxID=283734 RepID=UPI0018F47F2E|nr:hypothetical protein [Staphylococcus pseudintermedius]EGQ2705565.1 hypothetical protein [Staphylococcus pseudintermedius]EGQ3519967.1 hypothetical protein [Staphylococcus pseudintermedius]EHD0818900.1 hypothetical protein [Staphylococcus pseudintermedius]EHP0479512.1 hypothetical protein [Staphylococcus pseudintermedius]EII2697929.1 hypothetical protein [Staphylococcus pseudintermedius]
MGKNVKSLEDILKEIDEVKQNHNSQVSKSIVKQIKINEKQTKEDNLQDIQTHKEMINSHIVKELDFKRKARKVSIASFFIVGLLIILNLALVLYWNPLKLDYKVIITLVSVSFANLFAIILVVFKYIFSSTKEILDYNSKIYEDKE